MPSAVDLTLSLPQTVSIALGAALSTAVDYRVLVLAMSATMLACVVPLAMRAEDRAGEPSPHRAQARPGGTVGSPVG